MNILYLCDEYPPGRHGGIGTAVQLLARQMVLLGHNVVVAGFYDWGYGGDDHFDDKGVKVYRFRRSLDSEIFNKKNQLITRVAYKLGTVTGIFQRSIDRSLPKYHSFLEQLINRYSIDIIEMPDFNDYCQYCKKYTQFPKLSRPVVVKLHSSTTFLMRQRKKEVPAHIFEMERSILMQSSAVVSVSRYTAIKTREYFSYPNEIEVIYNGIPLTPVPEVVKDPNLIIYTGALVGFKGIYQLLKAWNIVHSKNPSAVLQVYGKGNIDAARRELVSAAVDSVIFAGHISRERLLKILGQASVAVFPSYIESFAFGPMEAMCNNTATIFTKRVSGPELITDGVDGLLIDPDNVDEIANRLLYLLDNPTATAEMAANGRNTIAERFEIGVIAAENLAFYQKVLGVS